VSIFKDERDAVETIIFGSGCLSYSWYFHISKTVEGWMLTMENSNWNGGNDNVTVQKEVTIPDLREAASKLLIEGKYAAIGDESGRYTRLGLADFSAGRYDDCDLDADVADLIIQQAVYGDVVFG